MSFLAVPQKNLRSTILISPLSLPYAYEGTKGIEYATTQMRHRPHQAVSNTFVKELGPLEADHIQWRL